MSEFKVFRKILGINENPPPHGVIMTHHYLSSISVSEVELLIDEIKDVYDLAVGKDARKSDSHENKKKVEYLSHVDDLFKLRKAERRLFKVLGRDLDRDIACDVGTAYNWIYGMISSKSRDAESSGDGPSGGSAAVQSLERLFRDEKISFDQFVEGVERVSLL